MSQAQHKIDNPDQELLDLYAHLRELSESSQSESRTDLTYADGSQLVLTSREGGEVEAQVINPKVKVG